VEVGSQLGGLADPPRDVDRGRDAAGARRLHRDRRALRRPDGATSPAGDRVGRDLSVSGKRPGPYCEHRKRELFITGQVPEAICDWHQLVCGVPAVVYPEALRGWARFHGRPAPPVCGLAEPGGAIAITSPVEAALAELGQHAIAPDRRTEHRRCSLQPARRAGKSSDHGHQARGVSPRGGDTGETLREPRRSEGEIYRFPPSVDRRRPTRNVGLACTERD